MHTTNLRKVGGSVMLAVPPAGVKKPVAGAVPPVWRAARFVAEVTGGSGLGISAASADEKPSPPSAAAVASPGPAGVTLVMRLEAASMAPVIGDEGSGACCAQTFGRP